MTKPFYSSHQSQLLLAQLELSQIPAHVAIIMDGNGRWAEQRGKKRLFGHQAGVASVREAVEAADEIGIKYLTVYSFSSENWSRPEEEVFGLMTLFAEVMGREIAGLNEKNVRVRVIGNLDMLPERTKEMFLKGMKETAVNTGLTLVIAVNYGARDDIVQASKTLAYKAVNGQIEPSEINEDQLTAELWTAGIPNPDLIIRTSGELRLSNFLLWESAYAEFYSTEELWPDFNRDSLLAALVDYQGRVRRYGGLA